MTTAADKRTADFFRRLYGEKTDAEQQQSDQAMRRLVDFLKGKRTPEQDAA